jgi:hypothetical protein
MSSENLQARDQVGKLGADKMIILKWIEKREDITAWTGFIGSGQGIVTGSCEHGNETSDSIKYVLPHVSALMYVTLRVVFENDGLYTQENTALWVNSLYGNFVSWVW